MNPRPLFPIALTLFALGCAEYTTAPDRDPAPTGNAAMERALQTAPQLPPVQPRSTFWTCAAEVEGRFIAAAIRIHQLELQALLTVDPLRQAVLLAQVAQMKREAQSALHFGLATCIDIYGAPLYFWVPGAEDSLVRRPFSLGSYHGYLVEKYLEVPEW